MAIGVKTKGLKRVLRNLAKEQAKVKRTTREGLIRAGFLVKGESQLRTPVDAANLKASAFVLWGSSAGQSNSAPNFSSNKRTGGDVGSDTIAQLQADHPQVIAAEGAAISTNTLKVRVGHTAFYALFVHEMKRGSARIASDGKKTTWNVGEPKFLQHALEENQSQILRVIADEVEL